MPHGKIYADVTETVGGTPLIYLNRLAAGLPARIAIKHEGHNPFNSVKDRIGYAMIKDAIDRGRLKPGMIIVEPTSGNTGIALSMVGAAKGYRVTILMSQGASEERRLLIRQLGAELGWHSVPVPRAAADAAGELVSRLPLMPARAAWVHAFRTPVLMDCTKARRELSWRPKRDSAATLHETAIAARRAGLV